MGAEVNEEDVRKKMSANVTCNVRFSKEHEGPYDIVLSSFCFGTAARVWNNTEKP